MGHCDFRLGTIGSVAEAAVGKRLEDLNFQLRPQGGRNSIGIRIRYLGAFLTKLNLKIAGP